MRIKLRWIATALNVGVTAATASLDDRETSSSVAGETTNASPAEMDLRCASGDAADTCDPSRITPPPSPRRGPAALAVAAR